MAKYFNMIRYRVGLPGVDANDMAEADNFEKIIRNERQVELFNEGYRYFDTRRWGTYLDEDANSSNWRGLDVTKDRTNANGNEGFWNIVTINTQNVRDRIALPKMVFLPIRRLELLSKPTSFRYCSWSKSYSLQALNTPIRVQSIILNFFFIFSLLFTQCRPEFRMGQIISKHE